MRAEKENHLPSWYGRQSIVLIKVAVGSFFPLNSVSQPVSKMQSDDLLGAGLDIDGWNFLKHEPGRTVADLVREKKDCERIRSIKKRFTMFF